MKVYSTVLTLHVTYEALLLQDKWTEQGGNRSWFFIFYFFLHIIVLMHIDNSEI